MRSMWVSGFKYNILFVLGFLGRMVSRDADSFCLGNQRIYNYAGNDISEP